MWRIFTLRTRIQQNQDDGGRHIENHICGYNSAIIARIWYFHRIWNIAWKWGPAERFTVKIHTVQISKMAIIMRPPSWNKLNGHNLDIFKRICSKFDTDTKNEVSEQVLSWLLCFQAVIKQEIFM